MRRLTLASAILLGACSTVVQGTHQNLAVLTPRADGAQCRLEDSKGMNYFVKSTPGNVLVSRGDGPLTVTCERAGFKTTTQTVEQSLEGWTLGNLIIGGAVGAGVDVASGAWLKYPPVIRVYMERTVWRSEEEKQTSRLTAPRIAGRWFGRGDQDACGVPWAIDLMIEGRKVEGTLQRNGVAYDIKSEVHSKGSLLNALAGRSRSSQGKAGPSLFTIDLRFGSNLAQGNYATERRGSCRTAVTLRRSSP